MTTVNRTLLLTTANLDGYASAALMDEFWQRLDDNHVLEIRTLSYSELQTSLELMFATEDAPYAAIFIVGLNPSRDVWNVLLRHVKDYKELHYYTHHQPNEEKQAYVDRIKASIPVSVYDAGGSSVSSSTILWGTLRTATPTWGPFLQRVSAWTTHNFDDMAIFRHGQLLSDLVTDIQGMLSHLLTGKQLSQLMMAWMQYAAPEAPDDSLTQSQLETYYRERIPAAMVSDFPMVQEDPSLRTLFDELGFRQALSAVAAVVMISQAGGLDDAGPGKPMMVYTLPGGELIRVFIPDERINMAIVHHLLYTLNAADVVITLRNPRQMEMRQNQFSPYLNLAEIAERYKGGGHRNAAGFPPPTTMRWEELLTSLHADIAAQLKLRHQTELMDDEFNYTY